MSDNTSATGGALTPQPAFVLGTPGPGQAGLGLGFLSGGQNSNDAVFTAFLGVIVVAVTEIPADLCRPRWQPEPPPEPDITVDWVAIGESGADADTFDYEAHAQGNQDAFDAQYRNEITDILCSFYGPNAGAYSRALRDAIQVPQNRETMQAAGIGLVETGRITRVPEYIKQRWYNRYDLPVILRRAITNEYNVLNLETASGSLTTDAPETTTTIQVQP